MEEGIIIKLISKNAFEELVKRGVIGESHARGNNSIEGKHSCGFYDRVAYNKYKNSKSYNPSIDSEDYLKLDRFHIGVSITKSHMYYIEDSYVK